MTLPLPDLTVVGLVVSLRRAERHARRTVVHDRTLAPVLALLGARRVVEPESVPHLVGGRRALGGLAVLIHVADVEIVGVGPIPGFRSEERRVGRECRSRWSPYH